MNLNNGLLTHLIEIVGRTESVIEIPYYYPAPYSQLVAPITPPVSASTGFTRVVMYVLNNIQSPAATPPTVHVNVWIRGGKDFRLAFPGITWAAGYTPFSSTVTNESGDGPDTANITTFGEDVVDITTLTRRPCLMTNFPIGIAPIVYSLPVTGVTPMNTLNLGFTSGAVTAIISVFTLWTYTTWINLAYYSNRGGYRYKIGMDANNGGIISKCGYTYQGHFTETNLSAINGLNVDTSNGVALSDQRFTRVSEFEYPSRAIGNFRPAYRQRISDGTGFDYGECFAFWTIPGTTTTNVNVYQSTADDFTLGAYLFPPVLGYQ